MVCSNIHEVLDSSKEGGEIVLDRSDKGSEDCSDDGSEVLNVLGRWDEGCEILDGNDDGAVDASQI